MAVSARTPEQFAAVLHRLMPPGWLFSALSQDLTWRALILALADSVARLHNRIANLRREADPRFAVELLPEWESLVGLPDGCIATRDATVAERRTPVVARLTATGGCSAAYFTERAAEFGYTATVAAIGVHRWRITVTEGAGLRLFRAGEAVAGDSLGEFGNQQFECLMNRLKQAHTELVFAYGA